MTLKNTHPWLMALCFCLLSACGGGGGGDRAEGVNPGPPPPGGSVPPPQPEIPVPNPVPYAEAEELFVFITHASIPDDGRPVVEFQVSDGNNTAILDLDASDVRFIIAKLLGSPLGNLTGAWQSYNNRIEQPTSGTGTEPRLQATTESGGEFTNNNDGTYSYRFITDITDLPEDIQLQASMENLDIGFQPSLTHRIAIQFSNGKVPANPWYDWQPDTGSTQGVFSYDIAATTNCNRCHDQLALHGGGRVEVKYCVTCHNPGSTDSDSTNTVDMKVMAHKIHRGAQLPSVQAGTPYVIYGYQGSEHDYSNVHYPQDIRNCVNCHAGTATGEGHDELELTPQGDNWSIYATAAACGSCHDDVDFSQHAGGQPDDLNCASCHSDGGRAGSIEHSHRMLASSAREAFVATVLDVENTAPGQIPVVHFKVSNPLTGEDYDIFNDPVWTQSNSALTIKVGWNTGDANNTGNLSDSASTISADALSSAIDNGDGSYRVSTTSPIPGTGQYPGIAASGSGVAVIEGHPAVDLEEDGVYQTVPLTNAHGFFSIDEVDGQATPRRQSVELDSCLACHDTLVLHGSNRSDNIDSCVSCHNPRNTDRDVREIAANPPTDGKPEESIDFKTMVHGIHAAAMREAPLQIVGYRGFNTHVYGPDEVHYPGQLSNCTACHTDEGFRLPLDATVLGTSTLTGDDRQDPGDDTVTSPATAVCSSCHDDSVATAHMTSNGGSFQTSQGALDDGDTVEQCTLCHGTGRAADVAKVHGIK